MIFKKLKILIAFLSLTEFGFSQLNLDSLYNIWNDPKANVEDRLDASQNLILHKYRKSNLDSCYNIAKKQLYLAQQFKLFKYEIEALRNLGVVESFKGDYEASLNHFNKSLKIAQLNNDRELEAELLMNISNHYALVNMYSAAMNYLISSKNIQNELGNEIQVGIILNNIGTIHIELNNFQKAIDCFEKALDIAIAKANVDLETLCFVNLALIAKKKNNYKAALNYCKKSIELVKNQSDTVRYASVLDEMSQILLLNNEYVMAKKYALESNRLSYKVGNNTGVVFPLLTLSKIYVLEEDFSSAKDSISKGYNIASKVGDLNLMSLFKYEEYNMFKLMNLDDSSKVAYKAYSNLKDALFSEKASKNVLLSEVEKKFIKQAKTDSTYYAEQFIAEKNVIRTKLENSKLTIFLLLSFLVLSIVLAISLYFKRNTIVKQKIAVDKAHFSIKESIEYSERIQKAVLPSNHKLKELFPDYFLIYLPKDIVSGDFYWVHDFNEKKLIALGDCTGHGVPGAYMTMMAINILTQLIEEGYEKPIEILKEIDNRLQRRLRQNDEGVRDGMDLIICLIDKNKINFCSAHHPLYLITKDGMNHFKGSKMFLGDGDVERLQENEISYNRGDMIYLCSDGFADQKGGAENRKYYSKRLKELILQLSYEDLSFQKRLFESNLNEWMNNTEQVDDITLIGIKL